MLDNSIEMTSFATKRGDQSSSQQNQTSTSYNLMHNFAEILWKTEIYGFWFMEDLYRIAGLIIRYLTWLVAWWLPGNE